MYYTNLVINAQQFLSSSELDVTLKVWESQADVDYLVDNGKPVSWTYNSVLANYHMFATYAYGNKFLVLTFTNDNKVYLCNENGYYPFENLFGELFSYLEYLPYFQGFNYQKIVYDIWWNRILIPIGTDASTGYSYAISIGFNDNAAINEVHSEPDFFNENNAKYYDLQGLPVDISSSKGKVIIKTDGQKTIKMVNR